MKTKFLRNLIVPAVLAITASYGWAEDSANPAEAARNFAPLQQWKQAVVTGDAAVLKGLYSVNPAVTGRVNDTKIGANADTDFWLGIKAKDIKMDVIRFAEHRDEHPDRISIIFHAGIEAGAKTVTLTNAQNWQKQGDDWRIIYVERTVAPQLKQPANMKKDLYPVNADARAEIKEAKERAAKENKRLLLVFGANWCYDCHVLDLAFHSAEFASAVAPYEVVHVDLGLDEKKNADLVREYDIPLNKGIPALAVAGSDGKLIVSQKNGEFENARALTKEALLEFLNKWKPEAR